MTNLERSHEVMADALDNAKWAVRYLLLHIATMVGSLIALLSGRELKFVWLLAGVSFLCSVYSGRLMRNAQELRAEADRLEGKLDENTSRN